MIVILKDKNAVIERIVQLMPRDMVVFETDNQAGVNVKINQRVFPVTGSIAFTTDCGHQLGWHSYKELVNQESVKLKDFIYLCAFDKPILAPNETKLHVLATFDEFYWTIGNARNLSATQILDRAEPVIVIPTNRPGGSGFVTVSELDKFNNKDPMSLITSMDSQIISFWSIPEFLVSKENANRRADEMPVVNLIQDPGIKNLVGPPVPDFNGALKLLKAAIVEHTRYHIEEVCQATLNSL